jgi:hypothetical protein
MNKLKLLNLPFKKKSTMSNRRNWLKQKTSLGGRSHYSFGVLQFQQGKHH